MKHRKKKARKRRAPVAPRRDEATPSATGSAADLDWQGVHLAGETSGGTHDQSVVDDLGAALGVPREPDEEFRPSAEILEERDRHRRVREE